MKRLGRKEYIIISIAVICLVILLGYLSYVNFFVAPEIVAIEVKDSIRFEGKKLVNVEVYNHPLKIDKSTWCLLVNKNEAFNMDENNWEKASNGYCSIITEESDYDVYIRDKHDNISSSLEGIRGNKKKKSNSQLSIDTDVDNVYLYKGLTQTINIKKSSIKSTSNLVIESKDSNVATVDAAGKVTGVNNGKTTIVIKTEDNKYYKEVNVVVTRLIKEMDAAAKRDYFTCQMLSEEENELLDNILYDRVNRAGYKTRAGVLAAARFLTLESTYEVPYFYENGRLENYEPYKKVDGEGRYYHRGLYLSTDKYNIIEKVLNGPTIWGCDLMNYTDWSDANYSYRYGYKYPNGLDCSGFVTWSLINGGIDVGDIGAGLDADHYDLSDIGTRVTITDELMASGRVKVGDLIGHNGHAAILIGWDDNNYYIAEALPNIGGVRVTTVNRSKLVHNSIYKFIILMDDVYKKDGNYTNMW